MDLPDEVKNFLREMATVLKGYERRQFMARTVRDLFAGVVNQAADTLFWNPATLRKALHELRTGIECVDSRGWVGRPCAQVRLPNLLHDVRDLAESQSQTDPRFTTSRLYTRLTAAEVRHQLIAQKGYLNATLPSEETIRSMLNRLGYRVRAVAKTKPQKRSRRQMQSSHR